LQAIWRAAAVKLAPRWIRPTLPSAPTTASRPIVGKPDSYALRAESTAIASKLPPTRIVSPRAHLRRKTCISASIEVASPHYRITALPHYRITASAEGVGAVLAGDLARSGSKPGASVDQTSTALRPHDRFALNRRQAGLLRPPGRSRPGAKLSRRKRSPWEGACSRFDIRRPGNMANVPASSRASSLLHGLFRRERICGARHASPHLSSSHRRITALPHYRIAALPLLPKA